MTPPVLDMDTDTRTDGGIAHDTHEGICIAALSMTQRTGNAVRILSCDTHGTILDELMIVTSNGFEVIA